MFKGVRGTGSTSFGQHSKRKRVEKDGTRKTLEKKKRKCKGKVVQFWWVSAKNPPNTATKGQRQDRPQLLRPDREKPAP